MKTEWDYTDLANAYLKRPDYAPQAINRMIEIAGVKKGDKVCDVGAGCAHLTIPLAERGMIVTAVEPNDAMRANGIKRTEAFDNVEWFEGVGEDTRQPDNKFDMVTFGSSFGVTDRQEALKETHRILKKNGWFACMWNHRDFNDPIQKGIEDIIKKNIPDYDYGNRREDQTPVIESSGLFDKIQRFEGRVIYDLEIDDIMEAWRSHATLQRQAKDRFDAIIDEIEGWLKSQKTEKIAVPYDTHGWLACAK